MPGNARRGGEDGEELGGSSGPAAAQGAALAADAASKDGA
jgi:hypothetical protein